MGACTQRSAQLPPELSASRVPQVAKADKGGVSPPTSPDCLTAHASAADRADDSPGPAWLSGGHGLPGCCGIERVRPGMSEGAPAGTGTPSMNDSTVN